MRQPTFTAANITYRRVPATKHQIEKLFNKNKSENTTIKGFLVGSNVNTHHYFDGWHLASPFEVESADDLTRRLNSFNFYLEPELGRYPALYVAA